MKMVARHLSGIILLTFKSDQLMMTWSSIAKIMMLLELKRLDQHSLRRLHFVSIMESVIGSLSIIKVKKLAKS
jgi:hypothetical protein